MPKDNEKKVERAFAVIENFEKRSATQRDGPAPRKTTGGGTPAEKSGIRICFAMDAVVSEQDRRKTGDPDFKPGPARLLDIRFTVPYIWQIPVIGKPALKTVRYFQAKGYPDPLRGLLRFLKRDNHR